MAEKVIFGGVTREKLEKARGLLKDALGDAPTGDAGTVLSRGYEVTFSFNEAASRIELILSRKPRFVPVWAIKRELKKRLEPEGIYEVNL